MKGLLDKSPHGVPPVPRVIQAVIESRAPVRIVKVVLGAGPPVWIIQIRATPATIAVAIATIATIAIETIIAEGASEQRTAEWVIQS
jgi:hypothetical protein